MSSKQHALLILTLIIFFNYKSLFGCNISRCNINFGNNAFAIDTKNSLEIDEICFNLIRVYHCLLDYVSEDCLINRNYVTSFNEIESKLKDFNCRLNKHFKNFKFYNFIKTHLTTTTKKTPETEYSIFNFKLTTKSLKHFENPTENTKKAGLPNNQNNTEPIFDLIESDYYEVSNGDENIKNNYNNFLNIKKETDRIYSSSCFLASLNKRCNFFHKLNFSYILSNDYRMGRRVNVNLEGRKKENNKFEALQLIDNSYLNLFVEVNFKLDFKIHLLIKATNCTKQKSYAINFINGHISQNEKTDDLIFKSKYNLENKIKMLFVYFKPFNFILFLNKNKIQRKFSLSIEYPDFNFIFNYNNQIDFSKFKSTLCNFNNRNFISKDKDEKHLINFNRIKLNSKLLNNCFYMNEDIIENLGIKNLENSAFLNLVKQACKFENLVNLIEAKHVSNNIYQLPSGQIVNNPLINALGDYKEINLNLFFGYNDYIDNTNTLNLDEDYAEDESIDFNEKSTSTTRSATPRRKEQTTTTIENPSTTNSSQVPSYVLNYDNIDNIANNQIKGSYNSIELIIFLTFLSYLAR